MEGHWSLTAFQLFPSKVHQCMQYCMHTVCGTQYAWYHQMIIFTKFWNTKVNCPNDENRIGFRNESGWSSRTKIKMLGFKSVQSQTVLAIANLTPELPIRRSVYILNWFQFSNSSHSSPVYDLGTRRIRLTKKF